MSERTETHGTGGSRVRSTSRARCEACAWRASPSARSGASNHVREGLRGGGGAAAAERHDLLTAGDSTDEWSAEAGGRAGGVARLPLLTFRMNS